MPKRERQRRTDAPAPKRRFTQAEMAAQVQGADPLCVASYPYPTLPPLMRCQGPCGRCKELERQYAAHAPIRDEIRRQWKPMPQPTAPPVED